MKCRNKKKNQNKVIGIACIMVCMILLAVSCGRRGADDAGRDSSAKETERSLYDQEESPEMQPVYRDTDFGSAFQEMKGCAVFFFPEKNEYLFYDENMCREETSPYSTFKIISALAGLKNGVITDEMSQMKYNGNIYGNPDWNGNLTLKEAFQSSCIWYFRQVIDAVGQEEIKRELTELEYGNCDVTEWNGSGINPYPELNGFWLDSSLKISPLEQVQVLTKIFEGRSSYDPDDVKLMKELMFSGNSGEQKIYGKTGSGPDGKAWFVGFAEEKEERIYFAVYLNDPGHQEAISGSLARQIAENIVKTLL